MAVSNAIIYVYSRRHTAVSRAFYTRRPPAAYNGDFRGEKGREKRL